MADLKSIEGFPANYIRKPDLAELLRERYPDGQHDWEQFFLSKTRYSQQKRLQSMVASLFPVRFHPCILFLFLFLFYSFLRIEHRNESQCQERTGFGRHRQ